MIFLLLASAIPLADLTKTGDGVFLQRPDPSTGKLATIELGAGRVRIDPPGDPRNRSIETRPNWVVVSETHVPTSQHDPLRTTIRFHPLAGPAMESLYPSEKISLVRRGSSIAKPSRPWSPNSRLGVGLPNGDKKWISMDDARLLLGEYHEDGDGLSMGGDVFAKLVQDRLEVVVTYEGSWRDDKGEGGYVHEETVYSYPLDWLGDGLVGEGFGTLDVVIRAER